MRPFIILSTLVAVTLAAPSPNAIARSIARRRAGIAYKKAQLHSSSAADESSPNWAGAVVTGDSITEASGSFQVLTAKVPTSQETGESEYTASAWVGLDGYGGCDGLWQAGVDSIVESSGQTSFYAWYEW